MTVASTGRWRRRRPAHLLTSFAALALVGVVTLPAGAVRPPTAATAATGSATTVKTASKVRPTTFPSVKVIDLATMKRIDLATFNATSKPQLVWIWSPS